MYNPDKVDDYSKKELAEMIFNGEISQEQVYKDGLFRKHRPFLEDELSLMTQEELDWTEATKKNTIGSYQAYLEKYNPTIVEGETVTDGWGEDTVYIGRHVEDALRLLQATVKKHNDDETENEKDKVEWAKATNANTIESYLVYISIFDRQPPMYRGQYVDEAKLRINRLQPHETPEPEPAPDPLRNETEDWATAVRVDTIEAYKNYLTKYESIGGKYVAQAKNAIERLLEEKTWSEALDSNDIDGYKKYISTYQNKKGKHLADAKLRLNQLEDDFAWMAATKEDNLSTFRDYLLHYDVLAPKYRGRHIEDVKKHITHIDDKEWEKANKANNLTAYRLYVNKFSGDNFGLKGKHIEEAETRIHRIMDDACWADAIKKNTIEAYQNYLNQYPHGIHSNEATENIAIPNPNPNGCLKSFVWLGGFVVLLFLGWQYWNHHWPFSQKEDSIVPNVSEEVVPVAEIDSLQWAITNHDIPLLQKYADLDSARAYYPLSLELWAQNRDTLNSLKYIRDAIASLTVKSPLYSDYEKHLNTIKDALDYDNTIGHVTPILPSNIEERLIILPKEQAIINKASRIAEKYSFKYTPNSEILKYIEDDFRRWVKAGDNSPVLATKEDCYKAALQLKEDSIVRIKLKMLYK